MTIEEQMTMKAIQSMNQKMPDMELRDLFAMHIIGGMLACDMSFHLKEGETFADRAYKYADEMMKARRKK